jgi:hypothetical protein
MTANKRWKTCAASPALFLKAKANYSAKVDFVHNSATNSSDLGKTKALRD